jgi:hypothetical protein
LRRCGAPERVLTASPALAAPIESIESIEAGATVASVDPATGEATDPSSHGRWLPCTL